MTKRFVLLEKCPKGKISNRDIFIDWIQQIKVRTDSNKFPDTVFYFIGQCIICYKDLKFGNDFIHHNLTMFANLFQMLGGRNQHVSEDTNKYHLFLQNMLKKYFNINRGFPFKIFVEYEGKSDARQKYLVEQHFRNIDFQRYNEERIAYYKRWGAQTTAQIIHPGILELVLNPQNSYIA